MAQTMVGTAELKISSVQQDPRHAQAYLDFPSADLEVQLVQLNHCDGVLGNHLKYLIRANNISAYSNLHL